MRIDLNKIAASISFDEIKKSAARSLPGFDTEITRETWEQYLENISPVENKVFQRSLF